MKRIICCVAVFAAFSVSVATAQGKATFDTDTHDFGTIEEAKGPVTHVFEFVNDGDMPLTVVSATASCGCTRPEFPKNPVAAGKRNKVKVTFNPAGRPGEFHKMVTVKYLDGKSKKNRKVNLKISGFVSPKE